MVYVIHHDKLGGFIEKKDGMNIGHRNPRHATVFTTREEALNARPGHHKDMGGSGFSGEIMTYEAAKRWYYSRKN